MQQISILPMSTTFAAMGSKREETMKGSLYRKYTKTARNELDPERKLKPSEFFTTLPNLNVDGYPKIVELNNIADSTADIRSTVDTDQPLFQTSPKVVIFDSYDPFSVVEKKLFFRNNDSVSKGAAPFNLLFRKNILLPHYSAGSQIPLDCYRAISNYRVQVFLSTSL